MSKYRVRLLARLALLVPALLAGADAVVAQTSCSGRDPVGWLGISNVSCTNCYFAYPGEGQPTLFSTEPRIAALAPGSPAAPLLRVGDILVSIDDDLITTYAGGRRLSNLKPGESVTLGVRRNGELITHNFASLPAICPYDARVLGSRARAGFGRGKPGAAVAIPAPKGSLTQVMPSRVFAAGLLPRASFGFGITCSECMARPDEDGTLVWQFRESPEIYSVESEGQAFRAGIRRGDLITRIDNVDITSAEGGRKFGQVQTGQNVRFTFQRGSSTMTRDLLAETRRGTVGLMPMPSPRSAQTENSMRAVRQLVDGIRVQETHARAQIEQLRQHEDLKLQELAQRLLTQQTEQTRKLDELHTQLTQIERLRASATGVAVGATTQSSGAVERRPDGNTNRYSGKLGQTDIEVRGPVGVYVERTDDEIIIYIGDSTIRLKKSVTR